MSASKELESIVDIVKKLLEENRHLRDDDDKLVANIWIRESGGVKKASEMTALDFLKIYARVGDGAQVYTSAESITRARRKLQHEHLHLRGEKYLSRMNEQELVKEFIHKTH